MAIGPVNEAEVTRDCDTASPHWAFRYDETEDDDSMSATGIHRIHGPAGIRLRRRGLRCVALVLAMSAPPSVALATVGAPSADAGTPRVRCLRLTGNVSTTFTLARCRPKNSQYLTATGPGEYFARNLGSETLTWSPSGQTSVLEGITATTNLQTCPNGVYETDIIGRAWPGGTSPYPQEYSKVKIRACVDSSGNLSLVPGTKAVL
jgi:hypothetical protein